MARKKCPTVKGLRVEIFFCVAPAAEKNTTRPLTVGQVRAVGEAGRSATSSKTPLIFDFRRLRCSGWVYYYPALIGGDGGY